MKLRAMQNTSACINTGVTRQATPPRFQGGLDEFNKLHSEQKAAEQAEKAAAEARRQQDITARQAQVKQNAHASFLNTDAVKGVIARLNETVTETVGAKQVILSGWDILEGIQQERSISGFVGKLSPAAQPFAQKLVSDLSQRWLTPSSKAGWSAMPVSENVADGMYKLNIQTKSFDLAMAPPAIAELERERETPAQKTAREQFEEQIKRKSEEQARWDANYRNNPSDAESPTSCVSDDDPRNTNRQNYSTSWSNWPDETWSAAAARD